MDESKWGPPVCSICGEYGPHLGDDFGRACDTHLEFLPLIPTMDQEQDPKHIAARETFQQMIKDHT